MVVEVVVKIGGVVVGVVVFKIGGVVAEIGGVVEVVVKIGGVVVEIGGVVVGVKIGVEVFVGVELFLILRIYYKWTNLICRLPVISRECSNLMVTSHKALIAFTNTTFNVGHDILSLIINNFV